jgi:hypothetical protein
MHIDTLTYELPSNNFVPVESIKKQIVIGHTFNHNMRHVTGWLHRYNGIYKKTAAFTIDAAGSVYQHFDPKYQSRYFNNLDQDKKSIIILIENDGWLIKDEEKNEFITWIGDIYNQPNQIVEKRWRGYDHWVPYSEKQIEVATELVKMLCEEFEIPMTAFSHNTKIENLGDYKGIVFKGNLDRHFTDLSPAWPFEEFKNKIEINQIQ